MNTCNVIDRILPKLQRVRALGSEKYIACCPAHQDSTPSLSLCVAGDGRTLLKCFAGCDAESIVAAIGLSMADLFPNNQQRYRPESKAERKRRAIERLRAWVQERLVQVCDLLHDVEDLIRTTSTFLSQLESETLPSNQAEKDHLWDVLVFAYRWRDTLEQDFEILNGNDAGAKLELWSRRAKS